MTLDVAVFVPDELGRVRKVAPGEPLPKSAEEGMRKRLGSSRQENEAPKPIVAPAADQAGDAGTASDDAPVVALGIDVNEASVKEVKEYLAENPDHAEAILAAEATREDGVRSGVEKAVAKINEA